MLAIYNETTDTYEKDGTNKFAKSNLYTGIPKHELVKILLAETNYYTLASTNVQRSLVRHLLRFASAANGRDNYKLLVDAMNSFDSIIAIGTDIDLSITAENLLQLVSYWHDIGKTKLGDTIIKTIIADYYNDADIAALLIKLY